MISRDKESEHGSASTPPWMTLAAVATIIVATVRAAILLMGENPSSSPEVVPEHPVQTTVEVALSSATQPETTPGADELTKAQSSDETDADELRLWKLYEDALVKGDALEARTGWLQWQSHAGRGETSKVESLLEKRWPASQRREIVLYTACRGCTHGQCTSCDGQGQCATCSGAKTCKECQGKRNFATPCTACLCRTCAASGYCGTCQGRGKSACTACRGLGVSTPKTHSVTCTTCKGAGEVAWKYRDSMRPCDPCKGRGKFVSHEAVPCGTCRGAKQVACSTCTGRGLCRSCSGTRRTPGCGACSGRGHLLHACKTCNASGACLTCAGRGSCPRCTGTGSCPTCRGKNVETFDRFPAAARFLPEADGSVFDENGWRTFSWSAAAASEKQTITMGVRICEVDASPGNVFHVLSDQSHHYTRPPSLPP